MDMPSPDEVRRLPEATQPVAFDTPSPRPDTHLVPTLIERYDRLCDELRLPQLDCALYEAMFVAKLRAYAARCTTSPLSVRPSPKHARRHIDLGPCIGALELVLTALSRHARRTVRVLRHIQRREEVVSRIITCCERYATHACTLEEGQETLLMLLQEHQHCTMRVAETVTLWRRDLSRPWPFVWTAVSSTTVDMDVNYLQRICDDCRALASSALGLSFGSHSSSALRIAEEPCCSQVILSRVLRHKQLLRRARLISSGLWQNDLSPALPPDAGTQRSLPPPRLRAAERVIRDEADVQQSLVHDLLALAQDGEGAFVPLLAIPQLFRAGEHDECHSVPLRRTMWTALLNRDYCAAVAKQNDPARVARDTMHTERRGSAASHSRARGQFTSESWLTPHTPPDKAHPALLSDTETSSDSEGCDLDDSTSAHDRACAMEQRRHERVTDRTLEELHQELLAERVAVANS